ETQTVTFYPSEAGKRICVAFDTILLSSFYVLNQVPIYGDSLIVYDGDIISDMSRTGALHDSMGNVKFISSAANGALTFVFIKQSAEPSSGWHASVSCVEPPHKDAGIWRIMAPVKGGNSQASVTVAIKNFGSDTLYGIDVSYRMDNGLLSRTVNEHCGDTLLPGEVTFYTFERTANLGDYNENYVLTVFTKLSGDENTSNDILQRRYFYRENIPLNGYRLWDAFASGYGAVSFNTNDALAVTTENGYKDGGTGVIVAGAPTSSYIYAYTMDTASHAPKSFVRLDHNWNEVYKVSVSDVPSDMAYDFADGCMYGIKYDAVYGEPLLLQIDLNSGEMTEKPLQYTMACIAIDSNGQMYGISDNGYFCIIDKTTGQVTPVSHSGVWKSTFFQSMTVDYNTGRMFWVSAEEGSLFEINSATGAFTNFGAVGGHSEISCLFGSVPDRQDTTVGVELLFGERDLSVYPNPLLEGLPLTIDGVAKAERMIIYDFQGRLIRVATGTGKLLRINGLRKGVYIIRAGNKAQRIIVH
ncbi:MAG: T9SS type A sorting domain-containing protein, partial [Bacteroidales bacterium]|nr:T9SS type A sorting domain-containing protein [Bacteroidales bacterium]